MGSPEQPRVFVPKGAGVRVVLEGGAFLDIKNPHPGSYTVEHKTPTPREAQREQLKAELPGILYPHVRARLTQHGYQLLGGEEVSGEMTLMETEEALKGWISKARSSGLSNREVLERTKDLLQLVAIGAPRMGDISALVKGINVEVSSIVDEIWEIKEKITHVPRSALDPAVQAGLDRTEQPPYQR